MARWVLDANVVVKWSTTEELSEASDFFRAAEHELVAPDVVIWEVLNVIIGKVQQKQLSSEVAVAVVPTINERFELYDSELLLDVATDQALRLNISLFDSLYLAVALIEQCPLVTADTGLLNATRFCYSDVVLPLSDFSRG